MAFVALTDESGARKGALGEVPTPNVLLTTVGGTVPYLTPTVLRRACGEHWPLALAIDVEPHLAPRRHRTPKAKAARKAAALAHGGVVPRAEKVDEGDVDAAPAAGGLAGGIAEYMALDRRHHLVLAPWDALRAPDFVHNNATAFSLNTRRGRRSIEPAQLASIANQLGLDACISPADEVPVAASGKRRIKAIERTSAWLDATVDTLHAKGGRGTKRARGGDGGSSDGARAAPRPPAILASLLLVSSQDERSAAKRAGGAAGADAGAKARAAGACEEAVAAAVAAARGATSDAAAAACPLRRATIARAVAKREACGYIVRAPLGGASDYSYDVASPNFYSAPSGGDASRALSAEGAAARALEQLPAAALRVWRGHGPRSGAPWNALRAVAAGFDLICDGNFAATLAAKGWASTYVWEKAASSEGRRGGSNTSGSSGVARSGGDGGVARGTVAIDLRSAEYRTDFSPLTPDSHVTHSKAYIHHLLAQNELLAHIVLCEHNLRRYLDFYGALRAALGAGGDAFEQLRARCARDWAAPPAACSAARAAE